MFLRRCPLLALLAVVPCLAAGPATQPAVPGSFMRFVDDDHGGGSLQTADVAFRNPAGVVVHLIAAVHIGEKSYYDGLNRDFKGYDAVLYELVNSKDAAPPVAGDAEKSDNPIAEFQVFLKDFLDLDFQLDDIDYTTPNFVHADLDRETFEKMQAERGESFEEIMLRQLIRTLANPPTTQPEVADDSDEDLISMLTRPDAERQIKVVIARQMGQLDLSAMGLDGPGGSVIVTERNKAALKVLADSMAGGKKNLAIFYGAAHMPDMTRRLEEMGFSPVSTQWNLAWDLTIRPNEPSAMEKLMRNLANSIKDNN